MLGMRVEGVDIDGQAHASISRLDTGLMANAIMYLGGEAAVFALSDAEFIRPDNDVLRYFNTVRKLQMGGCDWCLAALSLGSLLGIDAGDGVLLSGYHRAEALTNNLFRNPDARLATRRVALRLLEYGQLSESAAIEICRSCRMWPQHFQN